MKIYSLFILVVVLSFVAVFPADSRANELTNVIDIKENVGPTSSAGETWTNPKDGAVYVYVPAGEFIMKSNETDKDIIDNEKWQYIVYVDEFWIMKTEVTNAQYALCLQKKGCTTEPNNNEWNNPKYANHPVTHVSWYQASTYATWADGRLPTEAEWEKACRGTDGRIYPWGNKPPPDPALLNYYISRLAAATPVGSYPKGVSPYGVLDMLGNVWEWTSTLYKDFPEYPYNPTDGREDLLAVGDRVFRGGSFSSSYPDCAQRSKNNPNLDTSDANGFRVVMVQNNADVVVFSAMNTKYTELGGSDGLLGQPTSEMRTAQDSVGQYRHFANGAIYWHPSSGMHEVHGAIWTEWQSLGAEGSSLGYPITDELPTPDGRGRFNDFQKGSIVFDPDVGARIYSTHDWALPKAPDAPDVGQQQAPLTMGKDTQWPFTNIPVCWENPETSNAAERNWVQTKIENTWEAESAIDFTGWGSCTNNICVSLPLVGGIPCQQGIRIRIEDTEGAPHTKGLGVKLNGKVDGMSLNFIFNNWSSSCASPESTRKDCIEAIAVHEFGHALGFAHEQNRQDAPFNCQVEHQGSDGAVYITPYDLDSVMNYCNPFWSGKGELSPSDIQGVRTIYGNPPSTSVTNSTGRLAFYNKQPDTTRTIDPFCVFGVQGNDLVDFTQYEECGNDKAIALELINLPPGYVIQLSDHSKGKLDDDWTTILVKRNINSKIIDTFEASFEDDDVQVVYHHNNGLNGKVSQVVVTTRPPGPVIDLYEASDAEQNLVCSILLNGFIIPSDTESSLNFKNSRVACDNDEARSLILYDVPADLTFRFYDNPDGKTDDDWVEVTAKRDISYKVINSFENSFEDDDVVFDVHYDNGLDGKVSRFEFGTP